MKLKALLSFRSKLLSPCKKLLLAFRIRIKKPRLIKPLRYKKATTAAQPVLPPKQKKTSSAFLSVFRPQTRKIDRFMDLKSAASEAAFSQEMFFPSPLMPAFMKAKTPTIRRESDEVEDSCRSFENYLLEMIVEEGRLRDLMDVEELLYCWKNLKSPIFIDLVSRFYGELCKDLFSSEDEEEYTQLVGTPK